ncbi:sushi, von Willebrand factor type A, EGF and pentraxin domain-containing protein 1-like [Sycon ciliatum]|uniref:sushi, von Willebrand factor type A, EGF and pentraxin domain-containing protein 1-like n=1 Tax=Sycon ciliatum TaxID=27933 RepID=UPI0031F657C9
MSCSKTPNPVCEGLTFCTGALSNYTCNLACPALTISQAIFNTTSRLIGDSVNVNCMSGHQLVGPQDVICMKGLIWSRLPSCQVITCPATPSIANGHFSTVPSSFTIGGTANISCFPGYQRTGAAAITCGTSGQWPTRDSLPSCTLISCTLPSPPSNGFIVSSSKSPAGVTVFACNKGYELMGSSVTVCSTNGDLSHPTPACAMISCAVPSPPSNGLIVSSSTSPNGVTVFACNKGYKLTGSSVTVCLTNGTLSNPTPTCARVVCSFLTHPRNGSVSPGHNNFQAIRNYTCNEGFKVVGFATTICLLQGVWSAPPPTCQHITCPAAPPSIANGYISTVPSSFLVGGTANISCLPGYQRTGAAVITCDKGGEWPSSKSLPTCTRVTCSPLIQPLNGLVSPGAHDFDAIRTYTCNQGYTLVGSPTTKCVLDGVWSAPEPTCQRVTCLPLTHPTNGLVTPGDNNVNAIRNYTCIKGFTLVGFPSTTCLSNGVWSTHQPTCQRGNCTPLTHPMNGSVSSGTDNFEANRSYTCNRGYTLVGVATTTCLLNGVWSAPQPACQPSTTCPALQFENGVTPAQNTRVGEAVEVECAKGYQLKGRSFIVCLSSGQWSDTPLCTEHTTETNAEKKASWLGQSTSWIIIGAVSALVLLLLCFVIIWKRAVSRDKSLPSSFAYDGPMSETGVRDKSPNPSFTYNRPMRDTDGSPEGVNSSFAYNGPICDTIGRYEIMHPSFVYNRPMCGTDGTEKQCPTTDSSITLVTDTTGALVNGTSDRRTSDSICKMEVSDTQGKGTPTAQNEVGSPP